MCMHVGIDIRPCLTQKAAVRLVYYLVISRIDYANCLLYDLPQCLIAKLQRVQNAAARLVVRCHRCEHITPVLMKLHWLPVKQRVQNSALLLVFRAQHRQPHLTSPTYSNKELRGCYAQPRTMTSTCRHLAADTVIESSQ